MFNPHLPLDKAETIESYWYRDPKILDEEKDMLFKSMWNYVGRRDELKEVGSFFTAAIGDEPIVVLRNAEGITAFSNVCRHRGTVLAEGCGHMHKFICPYHGWTYNLQGELLGCTEPDGWQKLDKKANNLPEFAVCTLGPWIFVNANEIKQYISWERFIKGLVLPPLDKFEWHWREVFHIKCNWKVFVDNYVDGGYHIPYAHKALSAVADYSKYKTKLEEFIISQTVPLDHDGSVHSVRKGMAYYVWLFPNFMINISEGAMDTNWVVPIDEENCKVTFDFYFTPEFDKQHQHDSKVVSDQIQEEDIKICERVQLGLHSGCYSVGRYHDPREAGIYHFHKLLHRFIG
jgi:choline monooxygenase